MRILHTMLRVGNLDRALAFYTEILGMRQLRRADYPDGRFTLAFVGYADESESAVLELTHNWDTESYDIGTACLLYTSPSPRDRTSSRMPSSA